MQIISCDVSIATAKSMIKSFFNTLQNSIIDKAYAKQAAIQSVEHCEKQTKIKSFKTLKFV